MRKIKANEFQSPEEIWEILQGISEPVMVDFDSVVFSNEGIGCLDDFYLAIFGMKKDEWERWAKEEVGR